MIDMAQQSVAPKFWKRRPLTLLSLNAPKRDLPPGSYSADPEITETIIHLPRLPAEYDGLRIVHLSDIHLGLYTPIEEVQRVVDLANRLEPDMVALTGDYVTFSPNYIRPVAQALGRLHAPMGSFAVLGNHDFRAGADEVTRALRAQHICVLRNAHSVLSNGEKAGATGKAEKLASKRKASHTGRSLWMVGVDDSWAASPDLPGALHSVPSGDPKILLCHNPEGIGEASRMGIDLMLSGHTHGGQVRLPIFRSIYRSKPGERFIDGWNRLGQTQIYVSRGIGKVVVPLRVACRPEIACLSLCRN